MCLCLSLFECFRSSFFVVFSVIFICSDRSKLLLRRLEPFSNSVLEMSQIMNTWEQKFAENEEKQETLQNALDSVECATRNLCLSEQCQWKYIGVTYILCNTLCTDLYGMCEPLIDLTIVHDMLERIQTIVENTT